MPSYYHVINKWTTTDVSSPGYTSGLLVSILLERIKSEPLADVLSEFNIPEEYFDLEIYTNYATTAVALSHTGKIRSFASAKTPDNSICYSYLLYEDQSDQVSLNNDDATIMNDFNQAKSAYMQLLKLQCETKQGTTDISDTLLEKLLIFEPVDITDLESIFLSL